MRPRLCGGHGSLAVQAQLTAVDLGDQLPAEQLEGLGGDHFHALVRALDQVAVLAEMGAIGRRQGHPAFVVELALMRPNKHHLAPHHLLN